MSHAGQVACDITDPDGNHFQVSFSDQQDGEETVFHSLSIKETAVLGKHRSVFVVLLLVLET